MTSNVNKIAKPILITLFLTYFFSIYADGNMSEAWSYTSPYSNTGFGNDMIVLDFNGDGYDDVVVNYANFSCSDSLSAKGRIELFLGTEHSLTSSPSVVKTCIPDSTLMHQRDMNYIYELGDINSDGFDDFAYMNMAYTNITTGYLQVVYGNNELNLDSTFLLEQSSLSEYQVESLKDVNGDGFDDFGVNLRYYSDGAQFKYLLFLGGDSLEQITLKDEPFINAPFYSRINSLGDINNDNYYDFTFLVTYKEVINDTTKYCYENNIIYGNPENLFSNPEIITFKRVYNKTYFLTSAGDWNNDGYDDLIEAGPMPNGSRLYYGGDNINFDQYTSIESYISFFEPQIADVNGDGLTDLVFSYFYFSTGRFIVFLANLNGTIDYEKYGSHRFGTRSKIIDFNNDGYKDIIVTEPGETNEGYQGRMYVFLGNPNLEESDPEVTIDGIPVLENNINFTVYPNPFNPEVNFNISSDKENDYEISIYNVKGEKIDILNIEEKGRDINVIWDASNFSSGIYLAELKSNNKKISIKKITLLK